MNVHCDWIPVTEMLAVQIPLEVSTVLVRKTTLEMDTPVQVSSKVQFTRVV